jgi:hypothetical protein
MEIRRRVAFASTVTKIHWRGAPAGSILSITITTVAPEQAGLMPATYRVDAERKMVVLTLTGVVTGAELDGVRAQIREDPTFDPSFSVLVDASELNPAALTGATVRERAANVPALPMRIALVAPADAVFGMGRMYQMMTEGSGNVIEVFRGTEEAVAWLTSGGSAR